LFGLSHGQGQRQKAKSRGYGADSRLRFNDTHIPESKENTFGDVQAVTQGARICHEKSPFRSLAKWGKL